MISTPRIIFVAHGDHNFETVRCEKQGDVWRGHMDNLLGVYTVMQAYFSGRLPKFCCSIQITYGEQCNTRDKNGNMVDFAGARQVMETITDQDLIVVVDVTCLPAEYQSLEFSAEKVKNPILRDFLQDAWKEDFKYKLFEHTPDTEAWEDETDAFRQTTNNVFFFGIKVYGGDYNRVPVFANMATNQKAVEAMIVLANFFEKNWKSYLDKMPKSEGKKIRVEYDAMIKQMGQLEISLEGEEEVDSEDIQEEKDEWKDLFRKMKFSKNPIIIKLDAKSYEQGINLSTFFQNLKKSQEVQACFMASSEQVGVCCAIELVSEKLTEFFWKKFFNQSLFDCKYVEEAFRLKKDDVKGVAIAVKQKKIHQMVIYIHSK